MTDERLTKERERGILPEGEDCLLGESCGQASTFQRQSDGLICCDFCHRPLEPQPERLADVYRERDQLRAQLTRLTEAHERLAQELRVFVDTLLDNDLYASANTLDAILEKHADRLRGQDPTT